MNKTGLKIIFLPVILTVLLSCKPSDHKHQLVEKHLAWTRNAVIYEVNIRQYTPEGTFKAFREDLPRLKEMGVDIIWLMPIFPIGEMYRKATQTIMIEEIEDPEERIKYLGSYYSTRDYYSVNPEFGTLKDFKTLVDKIHKLGMYVILDIAVNHTAWDHEWITTHPEYYTRVEPDSIPWNQEWMSTHPEYYRKLKNLGMTYPIHPYETDWWDVADLNFDNLNLRNEFKEIFKYWIKNYDIDGYRCDAAAWVPVDFWNDLRPALDSIKAVFMLAESDQPELQEKAFDMTYDWKLHHLFNEIASGKSSAYHIAEHFQWVDSIYPEDSYLMQFTSNHDENSWNGTEFERMGEGARTFAVLSATLPDMLLIYNGQESAFNRRLKFFEKDTITWGNYSYSEFYLTLADLKARNQALLSGSEGGRPQVLSLPADSNIFAFVREKNDQSILVLCNLSDKSFNYKVSAIHQFGTLKELFTEAVITFDTEKELSFTPWQYYVFESIP